LTFHLPATTGFDLTRILLEAFGFDFTTLPEELRSVEDVRDETVEAIRKQLAFVSD